MAASLFASLLALLGPKPPGPGPAAVPGVAPGTRVTLALPAPAKTPVAPNRRPTSPPAPIPPRVKSPERIANEQTILAARRKILANLAEAERRSGRSLPVQEVLTALLLDRKPPPKR